MVAPISGRSGRALVTEGALVGKGEATPLTTIEQIDPIHVNFTQSSADLMQIRRAVQSGRLKAVDTHRARVRLILEDGSEYPQAGKLLFSEMSVDPGTGEITMRAEFPNAARELLPGMYVRVLLEQAVDEQAITVPQRAVTRGAAGASVRVVDAEGKVATRPIKVEQAIDDQWIVIEGLQGGEQVIVEGLQRATPGKAVKPMPFNAVTGAAAGARHGTVAN